MSVISQYQVVIPGQLITDTLWNGMELNIINNGLIPSGIEDYSTTDGQMQTATDPYPGLSTSRPTSLQGELERIRYMLAQITGETYWYQDADTNLSTMALLIPSGTKMVFYQASPPSGWTAVAENDKFLRVVTSGGTGGTTGGTYAASSSLAHAHTVNSHTHTISHRHLTAIADDGTNFFIATEGDWSQGTSSFNLSRSQLTAGSRIGSSKSHMKTGDSDTANTGASLPGTDTQFNGGFAYADVVIAVKD